MTVKRRDYQPIYDDTFRHPHRRRRRWLIVLLVLVILGSGVFGWNQWQQYQREQLATYPIRGVTLNQDSGYVDFQQLSQKSAFVYLQATSGATYTDDDFSDNYSRCQGANIQVGVAHTFSFTSSASQQYAHFKDTVGQDTGTLPIRVSVNYYDQYNNNNASMASQGQKLKKLVNLFSSGYQQGVIIFANQTVMTQFVDPVLSSQAKWSAGGKLKSHGREVKFIEYNADGSLSQSNQSQPVSRSVFNGSKQDWKTFIK